MAKRPKPKARNTKSPATSAANKRRRNWEHGTTLVEILLDDGTYLPAGLACSMKGGSHGPLTLTPDSDRWPEVADIPPTAVMPDHATTSSPA